MIDEVLSSPADEKTAAGVRKEVGKLVNKFPLYKDLIKRLEKE
jgi:glycine/serine hydroxymethyltransferase